MYVRLKRSLIDSRGVYNAGDIHETPAAIGTQWIRRGAADASDEPPEYVRELLGRLAAKPGERCLFLPFCGEFGHEVMSHLRLVHFHQAAEKIVCCRPGNQALYPSADGFITDWINPYPDAARVGTMRRKPIDWPDLEARHPNHRPVPAGGLSMQQEIHPIHPWERIRFYPDRRGLAADVVLGVRRRDFCPERNWSHWQAVADAITAAGLSFAVIGDRATSLDLAGQVCHSGDLDTDAAVELLQNCRLYIGTDTGSSHLAAAVGCPMLVFRETAGGSRDLTGHMAQVNPGGVEVVHDGWAGPRNVIDRMLRRLG